MILHLELKVRILRLTIDTMPRWDKLLCSLEGYVKQALIGDRSRKRQRSFGQFRFDALLTERHFGSNLRAIESLNRENGKSYKDPQDNELRNQKGSL